MGEYHVWAKSPENEGMLEDRMLADDLEDAFRKGRDLLIDRMDGAMPKKGTLILVVDRNGVESTRKFDKI